MALSPDYDRPALTMAERLRAQTPRQLAKAQRIETAFARERDEMDAIIAARPLGAQVPGIEPKSIYSAPRPDNPPVGLKRGVSFTPPIPKGTGPRKRWAEG